MNKATFILFSILLMSDVIAEEIEALDKLVITARPFGFQSMEHITQPAAILRDDELMKKQGITIGETLSLEPGVTASDFGQGASRPIIRGLGGPRLRVLQGGIGTLDISSLSVDHQVSINPMHADQVEVIRGPATLLYGSGNSAGLVNIVTNRIPESVMDFEASLDSRIESARPGLSTGFEAEGGIDNLALHIDGFHQNANNYHSANGKIQNSEIKTTDFNLGGSMIGNRGYMGISFGQYKSLYEIPFNPDEPDERVFIDLEQNRFDIAGQISDPVPGLASAKIRAAYNDYEHTEYEGPGEPGTFFKNNEWEGRLELNHKLLGPFAGLLGVQYQQQDFSSFGDEAFVGPSERNSVGLFLFEDMDSNNLHLEFGGRYERTENKGTLVRRSVGTVFTPEYNLFSVSTGAILSFNDRYSAGISAARSQRAPAIEELFADGPHLATETYEEGNPALTRETSNNLDFSINKTDGRWTWTLNLFVNYIEDFIYLRNLDENGDGVADLVNEDRITGAGDLQLVSYQQENAIFYGAEIDSDLQLVKDNDTEIRLRLFGDWVRGRLINDDNLARISPARLGAGITCKKGAWQAYLDGISVFSQNNTAPLESKTNGYFLLNSGINYRITSRNTESRIFLMASNLLNEEARRHTSFLKHRAPLPARSILMGIHLNY